MYNRYIRNDSGNYTRIREEEPYNPNPHPQNEASASPPQTEPEPQAASPKKEPPRQPPDIRRTQKPNNPATSHCKIPQSPQAGDSGRFADGVTGFLRHILDQFHLEGVDAGDLLLLGLLFLLSREQADEELLIALGLLLIL